MNEPLKLSDLPPSGPGFPQSSDYESNYSRQITHWPTLLATGAGVVVLLLLLNCWFTGLSQRSGTDTKGQPKSRYVSP